MGYNIPQKILNIHNLDGQGVVSGRNIDIKIDQCLLNDQSGPVTWSAFESLAVKKLGIPQVITYVDRELFYTNRLTSDILEYLSSISAHYGGYYSIPGGGISHQLHYERFGLPEKILLGVDAHVGQIGCLGMLGLPVSPLEAAAAMAGQPYSFTVPGTIRIHLTKSLRWGSCAKDVALMVLRHLSTDGARGYIIEYGGPGVKTLDIPQRATIANMGTEMGAVTSIFPSDEVTRKFLGSQSRRKNWKPVDADADAEYDRIINIDLEEINPMVAMPHSPDNVYEVNDVKQTPINQIFIGSCLHGGYRDIKLAAEILKGHEIHDDVELIVSPGSRQVLNMIIRDGTYFDLLRSGARLLEPGCHACSGASFIPKENHFALRTTNRNWENGCGRKNAKVILCGVETAAVSAIYGRITDPQYFSSITIEDLDPVINDLLIHKPDSKRVISHGAAVKPFKLFGPPPRRLKKKVLLKLKSRVSTQDILPIGPLNANYRTDLDRISQYLFFAVDSKFSGKVKKEKGGFIVAADEFGCGSSSILFPFVLRNLGIHAILAKSFSRSSKRDLVNAGVIPIICDDTGIFKEGEEIVISLKEWVGTIKIEKKTAPKRTTARHGLTPQEIKILEAGGFLDFHKEKLESLKSTSAKKKIKAKRKKTADNKLRNKKTAAVKPSAKQSAARKTAAKKSAAKNTSVRKSTPAKTTAKKTTAKKTAAKKVAAKKVAAKKVVAKEPEVKKQSAKKTAAKKTPTKAGQPTKKTKVKSSSKSTSGVTKKDGTMKMLKDKVSSIARRIGKK